MQTYTCELLCQLFVFELCEWAWLVWWAEFLETSVFVLEDFGMGEGEEGEERGESEGFALGWR